MHCDDDITGYVSETDTANRGEEDVTDYKVMAENLAKAVDEETYFTKTLSKNTVRISVLSTETYGKLVRHIQDGNNCTPYV
jgi:hypothetical protein